MANLDLSKTAFSPPFMHIHRSTIITEQGHVCKQFSLSHITHWKFIIG